MRKFSIYLVFVIFFCVALYPHAFSQNAGADTSFRTSAINYLISVYDKNINENIHLYNGYEPSAYNYQTKGHPFFETDKMQPGSISYDGSVYTNRQISYNILTDELVTLHYNNVYRFRLVNEKLEEFTLLEHTFVRLVTDSSNNSVITTGFYDRLYVGKNISVFARRVKKVEEHITAQDLETSFIQQNHYFFRINKTYYPVSNKKSVLRLFPQEKKQIQDFLRKNKIKYRSAPEYAMAQIASFCDQLKK